MLPPALCQAMLGEQSVMVAAGGDWRASGWAQPVCMRKGYAGCQVHKAAIGSHNPSRLLLQVFAHLRVL